MLRLLSWHGSRGGPSVRTESGLRGLRCRLRRVRSIRVTERLSVALLTQRSNWRHLVKADSCWRRDSDRVRIIVRATFNAVAGRQERVETLDELGISRKERTDPANHARSIYGAALEVFHDV